MRTADWIIRSFHKLGLKNIFGVTGGAVVHLFDAASQLEDLTTTFFNHEQSASFAVEAYVKITSEISVCIVTTGPGATNAITGLCGAWLDSVPAIYISGQARSNNLIKGRPLRQVGTQEIDIIPMVTPVTKYAVQIVNQNQVKECFINALKARLEGRPGPVWIDIPVDILWSEFNEELIKEEDLKIRKESFDIEEINKIIIKNLTISRRPLLLLGGGCRSPEIKNLEKKLNKIGIPFVTTWLGHDLVTFSENELHLGHVGISGQRGANLALGNADLLIAIGSSISNSVSTTKLERFAPKATKININIDENEFTHTVDFFDYNLKGTAEVALDLISKVKLDINLIFKWKEFNNLCRNLSLNESPKNNNFIHPFEVFRSLEKIAPYNSIFASDGGGTTVYSILQSLRPKRDQRLIVVSGLGSMGSGIPECIGLARTSRPVFLFCGDGSFPFNIQELQVIKDFKLPIFITVFSNEAYLSIRSTQSQFLNGKLVGSQPKDVHLINVRKISKAFDIEYEQINCLDKYSHLVSNFKWEKPIITEVKTDPSQEVQPRQGFAKTYSGFEPLPLTYMDPPLDKEIQDKINNFLKELS